MDRFAFFERLKTALEASRNFFSETVFNPFEVLISPIFIELSSHPHTRSGNTSNSTGVIRLKNHLQIQLRNAKYNYFRNPSFAKYFSQKNAILFFPVEPTHITQFAPIWKALSEKAIPYVIVTTRTSIFDALQKQHYEVFWLSPATDWIKHDDLDYLRAQIKAFAEWMLNENILDPKTTGRLLKIVREQLFSIWTLYRQMGQIFNSAFPKCVIPGYDITPEGRLITIFARQKGIPSYCIMHGSITGEPLDTLHIVDRFFVFGEAAKNDLIAKGTNPERLIVSGAPYLDGQEEFRNEINPVLREKLQLNNDSPYILIALSGPGHSTSFAHFQKVLHSLFRIASEHSNLQWIIKMHRKDRIEHYYEILEKFPDHPIKLIHHAAPGYPGSIFEWLQGASMLLTGTSSVAVEAMRLNIPVITMDFMNEYKEVDFIDLGTTIHVTEENALRQAINNLIDTPEVFREVQTRAVIYANQYFFKSNASATEIIVKNILLTNDTPN